MKKMPLIRRQMDGRPCYSPDWKTPVEPCWRDAFAVLPQAVAIVIVASVLPHLFHQWGWL